MASRPTAFMPLWIGDYLADTTHLSTDQHGAYLLLLMAYWRRGGPLPADDAYLCRIAGMTVYKWRGIRQTIVAFFEERDGVWISKRSDEELAKAEIRYGKRAAAGRKGGSAPKIGGRKVVYSAPLAASSASTIAANEAEKVETAEISHQEPSNASSVLEAGLKQSQPQSKRTRTTVSSNSETLSLVEPLLVSPNGKTPPRPASKPISSKRDRGTRWTAEVVSEEWIVAAIAAYPMVDCRAEAVAFVNFWISCSTPNAWKLNWRAAWMNWCGRDQKRLKERNAYVRPNGNGHAQGQLGATSKFQDDLKRELADLDAAERSRAH